MYYTSEPKTVIKANMSKVVNDACENTEIRFKESVTQTEDKGFADIIL